MKYRNGILASGILLAGATCALLGRGINLPGFSHTLEGRLEETSSIESSDLLNNENLQEESRTSIAEVGAINGSTEDPSNEYLEKIKNSIRTPNGLEDLLEGFSHYSGLLEESLSNNPNVTIKRYQNVNLEVTGIKWEDSKGNDSYHIQISDVKTGFGIPFDYHKLTGIQVQITKAEDSTLLNVVQYHYVNFGENEGWLHYNAKNPIGKKVGYSWKGEISKDGTYIDVMPYGIKEKTSLPETIDKESFPLTKYDLENVKNWLIKMMENMDN